MKIKVRDLPLDQVLSIPPEPHLRPRVPRMFFRTLVKLASQPDLRAVHFSFTSHGMERLGKHEPALILMNHSSFIDLKIAYEILYPRPFNIVCTSDGFVGKRWLMRQLGCIPTRKFMSDITLVRDMMYTVRKLRCSILMYPEASYSFDGTATPLPDSLGQCLKLLRVPVIMIRTFGAFARDPLYNNLQLRDTTVTARVEYLLSPDDIAGKTVDELNGILREQFTFDNFRWQQEAGVAIREPFRADGLNRVLYKCPVCGREGCMQGHGTTLSCSSCGREWELTEYGKLRCLNGESPFDHVPDWYAWERECVRRELLDGSYSLDVPVNICIMVDTRCIYRVGSGRLTHSTGGFHLSGCDGKLDVSLAPADSYSLYSDYFWYELGDMICIGDSRALYYCFPTDGRDVVAKTRLATEELYKIKEKKR
ncbi:MAG: 1-acyl-sn-glycerol-3-phosphate acyltransferase [Eubacteriales bacterium]|nr:1-acyl-sn-glycerol-3-phosphate acyltransferase [Eubacteriales bacterium]MDY4898987.1 1-acyl-sn-glycerol-3-phosphate acyltransferase [Eubacteriales bacterium]